MTRLGDVRHCYAPDHQPQNSHASNEEDLDMNIEEIFTEKAETTEKESTTDGENSEGCATVKECNATREVSEDNFTHEKDNFTDDSLFKDALQLDNER